MTMSIGSFLLHKTFQEESTGDRFYWYSLGLALAWSLGWAFLRAYTSDEHDTRRLTSWRYSIWLSLLIGGAFACICLAGAFIIADQEIFAAGIAGAASKADSRPVLVLGIAMITGAAEELFFRIGLMRLWNSNYAVLASAVLYSLVTLATGNLALVLAAFLLGIVSGFSYRRTRAWFTPIIIHGLWSIALIGIFPLL